jgi:tyrosinase
MHSSSAAVGTAIMLRGNRIWGQPATVAVRTRPDVSTLNPNGPELTAYRTAVQKMKQLPNNDPRNWTRQARIHNLRCPHDNWFFLPWHRAYLLNFEAICRELSGEPDFALPYWNWTINPGLPAPFFQAGSPLLNPRDIGPSDEAAPEAVGQPVIDAILANPDWIAAIGSDPAVWPAMGHPTRPGSSVLEGTPHNHIHGFVGGDMQTFMSPLDPIFWLHHCNIDRIWTEWDAAHPGQFPTDPTYNNVTFDLFVDGKGNPAPIKVSDLTDTEELGYNYTADSEAPVAAAAPSNGAVARAEEPVRFEAALAQPLLESTTPMVELAPPPAVRERLEKVVSLPVEAAGGRVIMKVEDISGALSPKIAVRAFLNCEYLTPQTPPTDPHYVGTFYFFGLDHDHGGGHGEIRLGRYLDATRTVARLAKANLYKTDEPLQLGFTRVELPRGEVSETPVPKGEIQIKEVKAAVY